jgi:hypothetical protein
VLNYCRCRRAVNFTAAPRADVQSQSKPFMSNPGASSCGAAPGELTRGGQ